MTNHPTVIISRSQSKNPAKRALEEAIADHLAQRHVVVLVPHLYDLKPDGEAFEKLKSLDGDLIVMAWMFPRAAHWVLDRNGIHGLVGETLLDDETEDDETEDSEQAAAAEQKERVLDFRERPSRTIYCLNLGAQSSEQPFIEEAERLLDTIAANAADDGNASGHGNGNGNGNGNGGGPLDKWLQGAAGAKQTERFQAPTNDTALNATGRLQMPVVGSGSTPIGQPLQIEEAGGRRWYPVIDFSRCTNCMECIDFCLFGVYGADAADTILVEQPDNCRKGCPACSRVCPENAIIFPQHKSPAIAGAAVETGGLKIDLSKLFGAPDGSESAEEIAARERDEQLVLAGRQAVGAPQPLPKRQAANTPAPRDDLDSLVDELDDLDL